MRVLLPAFDSLATLAGGVEAYVHHLAVALEDEGHEVRVLSRRPKRGAAVPAGVQYDWLALPALPPSHRTRFFLEPSFWRGVARAAPWADVVHGQNVDAMGALGIRPVVATAHTTPIDEWPSSRLGGWREALYQRRVHELQLRRWRRFVPRAARLWTPGEHVAGSLRMLGARRVDVLANPVAPLARHKLHDARAKLGLPSGPLVLYLGRLASVKRVDRLIRAVDEMPDVTAVIAGVGPEEGALRAMAGPRVKFMGRVDDETKALLLCAADAFCLPSEHEGQPLALLEATSVGTPVVATRAEWVPPELRAWGHWGEDLVPLLRAAIAGGRRADASVQSYRDIARAFSKAYDEVRAP